MMIRKNTDEGLGFLPVGSLAAIAQIGVGLAQAGTSLYIARQDRKEAAKNANRQEQMAQDEAARAAALQRDLAARQERVELAKMGLDAAGKPIPGRAQGLVAKVPGGWATIGGVAVVGLIGLFVLLRRSPAGSPKTNPRRRSR